MEEYIGRERLIDSAVSVDELVDGLLNRAFVAQVHSRGSPFDELSPPREWNLR
jgi:hypothetical protein